MITKLTLRFTSLDTALKHLNEEEKTIVLHLKLIYTNVATKKQKNATTSIKNYKKASIKKQKISHLIIHFETMALLCCLNFEKVTVVSMNY